jgi:ABC-2 type transport system permease protein
VSILKSRPAETEMAPEVYHSGNMTPSAFGDDFRRFANLTYTIAATDFKLRYFGSALGYVWSLIRPLLFFGVLWVVYTQIFGLGKDEPGYPTQLLTAVVLWTFFIEATSGCVTSLVGREGLLRKMRFPRLVVPAATVLTAMFNLGMNLVAVLVFSLINGNFPRIGWLEMPLILGLWVVLALGIGMLLSVLYVRFRDIQPIWEVLTQVLFYASPIIYAAKLYPTSVFRIAMGNPIAALLEQQYKAFVNPQSLWIGNAIGGNIRLLIPLGIIFGLFGLGLWAFNREAPTRLRSSGCARESSSSSAS